ncbi:Uncharacterised protein [Mycobacterium tuberculosis]|nr:Uncharacterised protein [Mycobacterium tuberculosis]
MVPDFVGDDIGLGKIAGSFETLLKLAEEVGVEVKLLVDGAVERAGRGRCEAAC